MTLLQAQKFTIKFTVLLTTALLLFFAVLLMIGETHGKILIHFIRRYCLGKCMVS